MLLTNQIKQHSHALNFNTNYLTVLYSHCLYYLEAINFLQLFNSIFNVVPNTLSRNFGIQFLW